MCCKGRIRICEVTGVCNLCYMITGAWSDVGAAAGLPIISTESVVGIRDFTSAQGLTALERIMTSREVVQAGVSEVVDWNLLKDRCRLGKFFDEIISAKSEDKKYEKYDYLIEETKKATSLEDREAKIRIYMEAVIKQTLNLPESEILDVDQNFSEMGLDSLMGMELKNKFQAFLGGRTITITSFQENRTIASLSAHLACIMEEDEVPSVPSGEVIKPDIALSPPHVDSESTDSTTTNSSNPTIRSYIL